MLYRPEYKTSDEQTAHGRRGGRREEEVFWQRLGESILKAGIIARAIKRLHPTITSRGGPPSLAFMPLCAWSCCSCLSYLTSGRSHVACLVRRY